MLKPLALGAALALASLAQAQSLTPTFTFQGELHDGPTAVTGTYDLRFRLFDTAIAGSEVAVAQCADNVAVVDGRFAVLLSFNAFAGQRRFLEVEARQDTGLTCGNAAGLVILSPRQELTPTPNAIFSMTAGAATSATNATQLNGQGAAFYLNAANLSSGTIPDGRLSGAYSGVLTFTSASNAFTGSGAGLTALNASNVSTGTIANARTSGTPLSTPGTLVLRDPLGGFSATGITANNFNGAHFGDGSGLTNLDAANIASGTLPVARIPTPLSLSGADATGILSAQNASGTTNAAGVLSVSTGNGFFNAGVRGSGPFGVIGVGGTGVSGTGNTGVTGTSTSTNPFGSDGGSFSSTSNANGRGVYAQGSRYGVYAETNFSSDSTGVFGNNGATVGPSHGVHGRSSSPDGMGVYGENTTTSGNAFGVYGTSSSPVGVGVYGTCSGTGATAVRGEETNTTVAVSYGGYFSSAAPNLGIGVHAIAPRYGVEALGSTAVIGLCNVSGGKGVEGVQFGAGFGVFASGNLGASGAKPFRIDHPDDPENKYLLHYCTESPEILNAYSGTIMLDAAGGAVVELPRYFAKINKDPRYTLTAVGAPMPLLHVAQEIDESSLSAGAKAGPNEAAPVCSFRIAGGAPGAKVSWEVKAVRNDRWVQQHGAPVEVDKPEQEKGKYQHPDLYGQPAEKGMSYDPGSAVPPGQ